MGRELQALEITLFQYRKGEGERERDRERGGEREGNENARKSGRSPDHMHARGETSWWQGTDL